MNVRKARAFAMFSSGLQPVTFETPAGSPEPAAVSCETVAVSHETARKARETVAVSTETVTLSHENTMIPRKGKNKIGIKESVLIGRTSNLRTSGLDVAFSHFH